MTKRSLSMTEQVLRSAIRELMFELKIDDAGTPEEGSQEGTPATPALAAQEVLAHFTKVKASKSTIRNVALDLGELVSEEDSMRRSLIDILLVDKIKKLGENLSSLMALDAQHTNQPPFALLVAARVYSQNDYGLVQESRRIKRRLIAEGVSPEVAREFAEAVSALALRRLRSALGQVDNTSFSQAIEGTESYVAGVPLQAAADGTLKRVAGRVPVSQLLKSAVSGTVGSSKITTSIAADYKTLIRETYEQLYPNDAIMVSDTLSRAFSLIDTVVSRGGTIREVEQVVTANAPEVVSQTTRKTSILEALEDAVSTRIDELMSNPAAAVALSRTATQKTGSALKAVGTGALSGTFGRLPGYLEKFKDQFFTQLFKGLGVVGGTLLGVQAALYAEEPGNPIRENYDAETLTFLSNAVQQSLPISAGDLGIFSDHMGLMKSSLEIIIQVYDDNDDPPVALKAPIAKLRSAAQIYSNLETAFGNQTSVLWDSIK